MFTVMSDHTPVVGRIVYPVVESKEIQINCKIFFYHCAKNKIVFNLEFCHTKHMYHQAYKYIVQLCIR